MYVPSTMPWFRGPGLSGGGSIDDQRAAIGDLGRIERSASGSPTADVMAPSMRSPSINPIAD
jgi:hypothetical protein